MPCAHQLPNETCAETRRRERHTVSKYLRVFSAFLGVSTFAGLSYVTIGVARRRLHERRVARERGSKLLGVPSMTREPRLTPRRSTRTRDALDVALDLDGIFEPPSAPEEAPTVRTSERAPIATGGDDEEPLSPEDLGRAWLTHATLSERSRRPGDLLEELENIAAEEVDRKSDID